MTSLPSEARASVSALASSGGKGSSAQSRSPSRRPSDASTRRARKRGLRSLSSSRAGPAVLNAEGVVAFREQHLWGPDGLNGGEAAEARVVGEELVGGDKPDAADPAARGHDVRRGVERAHLNAERRARVRCCGGRAGGEREDPRQKSEGPPA